MFRCRAIKCATWKQRWKVDQRGERCHDIWPCLHKEKWVGIQKQRAWKEQEEGAWNIFCLEFLCGHEVKDERYMEGCCWNQSYSTYCVSAHHNINLHTNNTPLHLQTACSAHTSPSHYPLWGAGPQSGDLGCHPMSGDIIVIVTKWIYSGCSCGVSKESTWLGLGKNICYTTCLPESTLRMSIRSISLYRLYNI